MKTLQTKVIALLAAVFAITCGAPMTMAADFDQQPVVKRSVAPENPQSLTGMVMAMIEIDANGAVRSVTIEKSTDPSLEAPVVAAVGKWVFSPALKDGQAVSCKIKVPFKFQS